MSSDAAGDATIEWFGATTFRLKAKGLTIFLDTWLDRPESLPKYLSIDDVNECDYIFVSHAHFDHLPGTDRLAKRTGALVVGNGEVINVMRDAGVADAQLMAVAGGERIALFTADQRKEAIVQAKAAMEKLAPGQPPPGPPGPPMPPSSDAVMAVHIYPSLHCLMPPGDHRSIPEMIDSGTIYTGSSPFACTADITRALTYGLGGLMRLPQLPPAIPEDMQIFLSYLKDTSSNKHSFYDGGQLLYNFLLGEKTLLWNGHLGEIEPQPDIAILGIAGRANLNGRPYDGSAAQFATEEIKWLGQPDKVIWCLHDQAPLNPKYIDTDVATSTVERETRSRVLTLKPGEVHKLFASNS
ncbi:hypothetical protein BGW36DRAFT_388027 [Talaromyces proteolyticus]|uniref:Metallo-beta-lactamase domain-containing protein n=1 Tax=Talaromyces proteolyticus TaxID=1131652 RepID=A0AAD4KHG0_9EURO|nr:uncharacterized protein BGW36DRAFT_388027 [Talaromyces proteolyticus]KAH8691279.1 hypothetical protein BGW36DRAFT_388027 [Talaromyces proteolyticus]